MILGFINMFYKYKYFLSIYFLTIILSEEKSEEERISNTIILLVFLLIFCLIGTMINYLTKLLIARESTAIK